MSSTFLMRGISSFAVLYLALTCISAEKKIVCYIDSDALSPSRSSKFDIHDIDASLCTHLICRGAILENARVQVRDPELDLFKNGGKDGFKRFNALRQSNTIKTLVSIRESNRYDSFYEIKYMLNPKNHDAFVNSAVDFVKRNKFNGLNWDWENEDKLRNNFDDYIRLLKRLKGSFDQEKLILSATVNSNLLATDYNIEQMSPYLDFINFVVFAFHSPWNSNRTRIFAPLYSSKFYHGERNVNASITYWTSRHHVPKEKFILGVASFGYSYYLKNSKNHEIGALTNGPRHSGPYTKRKVELNYNEICEEQKKDKGWTVEFDKPTRTSYAYKDNYWVTYENAESIQEKAKLVNKYQLGGVMLMSIDADDFRGTCSGTKYPLLRAINEVLHKKTPASQSIPGTGSSQYKSNGATVILCIFFISFLFNLMTK